MTKRKRKRDLLTPTDDYSEGVRQGYARARAKLRATARHASANGHDVLGAILAELNRGVRKRSRRRRRA